MKDNKHLEKVHINHQVCMYSMKEYYELLIWKLFTDQSIPRLVKGGEETWLVLRSKVFPGQWNLFLILRSLVI